MKNTDKINVVKMLKILEVQPQFFPMEKDYSYLEVFTNGLFRGLSIANSHNYNLLFQQFINKKYQLKYYTMWWSYCILCGPADNDKSKAWDIFFENIYDFIDQLPEEE